jgi:hypothetical protein
MADDDGFPPPAPDGAFDEMVVNADTGKSRSPDRWCMRISQGGRLRVECGAASFRREGRLMRWSSDRSPQR